MNQFVISSGPGGPGEVACGGSLTNPTTGQVCSIRSSRARSYQLTFDASTVAVAALVVNIQSWNSVLSAWQFMTNFFYYNLPQTGTFSATNGSVTCVTLTGPFDGLALQISSWGTSTGTFNGIILAL